MSTPSIGRSSSGAGPTAAFVSLLGLDGPAPAGRLGGVGQSVLARRGVDTSDPGYAEANGLLKLLTYSSVAKHRQTQPSDGTSKTDVNARKPVDPATARKAIDAYTRFQPGSAYASTPQR